MWYVVVVLVGEGGCVGTWYEGVSSRGTVDKFRPWNLTRGEILNGRRRIRYESDYIIMAHGNRN